MAQTLRAKQSVFKSPLTRSVVFGVTILLVYILIVLIRGNLLDITLDFALVLAGLLFWLFVFSQFILPVHSFQERWLAFERLILYLMGAHGPAEFIKDGELVSHASEQNRRGAGIIWLDTASGALLRTNTRYTRPIGPGIVFTEEGEYLAGSVDLHIRTQKIGPSNEDPFAPIRKDEVPENYHERQERRRQTQAFTRDGIELVPTILMEFRIEGTPRENNTEFGFNPTAVQQAIIGRPITIDPSLPPKSAEKVIDWFMLAPILAVEVWRDSISKFRLNELFPRVGSKISRLQEIQNLMNFRLQNEFYPDLDEYGNPTQTTLRSQEFSILHGRGLRVNRVIITDLCFEPEIEESMEKSWRANWLITAQRQREWVDEQRKTAAERGNRTAEREYAETASYFLGSLPSESNPTGASIYRYLIRGTLRMVRQNSELYHIAAEEIDQLHQLEGFFDAPYPQDAPSAKKTTQAEE